MTTTARVLVTGATRFLGSHCLAPLVERGFDVLGLYRERAPRDIPGVQWVRGDVMDGAAMRRLFEEHKPRGLLHLAWFVEPGRLITDSSNLSWASVSLDLIRSFRDGSGERCTVSGWCYEYDCRFGYCVEDVSACERDTLYGAAKDSLRRTFLAYCNVSHLSGSWGRAFFMYGPRANPARLVSSVIISLLKGSPVKSSHYNIAASTSATIREIVGLLGEITGHGDGAGTLNDTGSKPRLTHEAGLSATIDWWRAHLDGREG